MTEAEAMRRSAEYKTNLSRHNQTQVGTKKVADISATFRCPELKASHLAITSPDSHSSRDHNRREHSNSIYIRRSMRERSRRCSTLGRIRRKQGRSRHNSRTLVRHNNRNPGHRRMRWTLCHRSPRQQLVRLRDRGPNHPATLELVMVSPRQ